MLGIEPNYRTLTICHIMKKLGQSNGINVILYIILYIQITTEKKISLILKNLELLKGEVSRLNSILHLPLTFFLFLNQAQMESNPGGGQFYSSSKVISYSSNGSGQPKYYEASSETTKGPDGVTQI